MPSSTSIRRSDLLAIRTNHLLRAAVWSGIALLLFAPARLLALPVPLEPDTAALVNPAPNTEDVLAELIHASGAIFSGEVYAIRLPAGAATPTAIQSTGADMVDVEFRVDVGVRGTSVGTNYVVHMSAAEWQEGAPFALHQRAMVFLRPSDAAGLSGPVRGAGDTAAQPTGVLPLLRDNTVDLSRLGRLSQAAPGLASGSSGMDGASPAPAVPDISSASGRDTLVSGSTAGRMPEPNAASVPFLALLRDVSVLSAAESPGGAATAP